MMRQLAGIALVVFALFVVPKMDGGGGGGTIDPNGTADIAEQVLRIRATILRDTYSDAAASVSGGNIKHATDLAAVLESGVKKADETSAIKFGEDAKASLPDSAIDNPAEVARWLSAASEGFGRVAQ